MRGSIAGGLWAVVLGGAGLGVVSLVNEQPAGNEPPQMPQVAAPAAVQVTDVATDTTAAPPVSDREFVVTAPRVAEPEAEVTIPATDTEPAAPPQTLQLETQLDVAADVGEGSIDTTMEEPVLPATTGEPPQVPSAPENIVIPSQPEPATPVESAPDAADVAGIAEDALLMPAPAPTDATPVQDPVAADPVIAEVTSPEVVSPETVEVTQEQAPAVIAPKPVQEPVQQDVDVPTENDAPVAPTVAETAAPVIVEPAPTAPVVTEQQQAPQVRVNRLGAAASEPAGIEAEVITEDETGASEAAAMPALVRYGTPFENPADLPMLAVLLIDDGTQGDLSAQVAALPMPVTVVIGALEADATARMAAYRAAGVEVAMQMSLPVGAVPTDVEIAFEAALGILPEATLLFSDGAGFMQSDRTVTAQVMQVLGAGGLGLVNMQRGLGSAGRDTTATGVPTATILRDIDGAGENPDAIERSLDQSALRARQSGDAVLLGRVQTQTLEALSNWAGTVHRDQMALAPVTAILRANME